MRLHVRVKGPTVEGYALEIVDRMLIAATAVLTERTKAELLGQLHDVLQHPTGYYESRVQATQETEFRWRVNDGGVVYGPWLEGVGSRNYPATRFRGYRSFEIVRNRMAQRSRAIIDAEVARIAAEL
jgi:hypothetical protein